MSNPEKLHSMLETEDSNVAAQLANTKLTFHFNPTDDPHTSTKDYDTNVMGRFWCRNPTCPKNGWASKAIAITIRLYTGSRYNARIYHQRCKQCNHAGELRDVDSSYAERVAYRLKKWSGLDVQVPRFEMKKSREPHQSDLCEGCRQGHCKLGREDGGF